MKEYDPEWARSFYDGIAAQSCNHQQMLRNVKVPVLFTHHRRTVDPNTGMLSGAISDFQAQKVKELVEGAGQKFEYVSLSDAAHSMHREDPQRFVGVLRPWAIKLSAQCRHSSDRERALFDMAAVAVFKNPSRARWSAVPAPPTCRARTARLIPF